MFCRYRWIVLFSLLISVNVFSIDLSYYRLCQTWYLGACGSPGYIVKVKPHIVQGCYQDWVQCRFSDGTYEPEKPGCDYCFDSSVRVEADNDTIIRPSKQCGSVVKVEQQILGESIAIDGTKFSLVYNSNYADGRTSDRTVRIPLHVMSVDNSSGFNVNIIFDGQTNTVYVPMSSNIVYEYIWDGKNRSGVSVPAMNIKFVVDPIPDPNFQIHPFQFEFTLTKLTNSDIGLGNWALNILHQYSANAKLLLKGDGTLEKLNKLDQSDGTYWVIEKDNSQVYVFNTQGQHLKTKSGLLGVDLYTFNYDGSGKLLSVKDQYNNMTVFNRDTAGKLISITAPNGQVSLINIDSSGWLSQYKNSILQTYNMTYTSTDGLLASFQKPNGALTTFSYDSKGKLTYEARPNGGIYSIIKNDWVFESFNSLGKKARYSLQSIDHEALSFSRSSEKFDGSIVYDSVSDARIKKLSPFENFEKTFNATDVRFGKSDKLISSHFDTTPNGNQKVVDYVYSASSSGFSPSQYSETATVNSTDTWVKSFDLASMTWTQVTPENKIITTKINSKEQPIEVKYPGIARIDYDYKTTGELQKVTQGDRITHYEYSVDGFLNKITNALGEISTFIYNSAGQLLEENHPNKKIIKYEYDQNNNITAIITPKGLRHSFNYGATDELSTYVPPLLAAENPTQYLYNTEKQLTQVNRPSGQSIYYYYDTVSDKVSQITDGFSSHSYIFSGGYLHSSSSADQVNNFYSYDKPLLTKILFNDTNASIDGGIGFVYNNLHKIQDLNILGAGESVISTIQYTYNKDEEITSAGDLTITRDPTTGFITQTSVGVITEDYTYNTFGEVVGMALKQNGTAVYSYALTRDKLGRVTVKDESAGPIPSSLTYEYDGAGRLLKTKINGTTITSNYVYDDNSNLLSGKMNGTTFSATYDNQDRVQTFGAKSFTFNFNGELTSSTELGQTTYYQFDTFGKLKSVTLPSGNVYSYKYDAQGRRVARLINNVIDTYYVYQDGLRLVAELDASNNLKTHYIYASKPNVPDYMIKNGIKYKIVSDHIGSVKYVLNTITGATVQKLTYGDWGKVIADTNAGFQSFGYAGGLYDKDTRLVHFGAREYDGSIGRWLSKDPILFNGGDVNLFGYALQDPINKIDPKGTGPLHDFIEDVKDAIDEAEEQLDRIKDIIKDAKCRLDPSRCDEEDPLQPLPDEPEECLQ